MDLHTERNPAVDVARQRATLLRRSAELLQGGMVPLAEQYDALPQVSGLLGAALEELKGAEEKLKRQKDDADEVRADLESRVRYYRQLFEYAPAALLVTDQYGSIADVNRAAAALLKRTPDQVAHRTITTFIPREGRQAFRDCLARLSLTEAVHDWRFILKRVSDVAVEVTAAVQLVPGIGLTRSGALHWLIRPVRELPMA